MATKSHLTVGDFFWRAEPRSGAAPQPAAGFRRCRFDGLHCRLGNVRLSPWPAWRLAIRLAGIARGHRRPRLAEWSKYGLTGKHLTPREAAQDVFVSGLLAASGSSLLVLQSPAAWSDLFALSSTVAAVVFTLYHAINTYRLASGRHLSTTAAAMIVAPPYLLGALLLLEPTSVLQAWAGGLTTGLPAAGRAMIEGLGRLLVVFAFNEAVVNGIGLAVRRTPLRSLKAHALFRRWRSPWLPGRGSPILGRPGRPPPGRRRPA